MKAVVPEFCHYCLSCCLAEDDSHLKHFLNKESLVALNALNAVVFIEVVKEASFKSTLKMLNIFQSLEELQQKEKY